MHARGSTIVTPDILDAICQRIEEGRTLRDITRDADMPSHEAVYQAMKRDPKTADAIARARMLGAHGLAESVVSIADECDDPARAQIVRNRCDQRRWLAGKWNATYSDSTKHETRINIGLEAMVLDVIISRQRPLVIDHEPDEDLLPPTDK